LIKNEEKETIKTKDLTIEEKNITPAVDQTTADVNVLHLWIPTQSKRKAIDQDQYQAIGIKKVRIIIINKT
jgi:hypothetical protein